MTIRHEIVHGLGKALTENDEPFPNNACASDIGSVPPRIIAEYAPYSRQAVTLLDTVGISEATRRYNSRLLRVVLLSLYRNV